VWRRASPLGVFHCNFQLFWGVFCKTLVCTFRENKTFWTLLVAWFTIPPSVNVGMGRLRWLQYDCTIVLNIVLLFWHQYNLLHISVKKLPLVWYEFQI
jgi:hypothetical protein